MPANEVGIYYIGFTLPACLPACMYVSLSVLSVCPINYVIIVTSDNLTDSSLQIQAEGWQEQTDKYALHVNLSLLLHVQDNHLDQIHE